MGSVNAIELKGTNANDSTLLAWACGKCGYIDRWSRERADECCVPLVCSDCGGERKMAKRCDACWDKHDDAAREVAFVNAKKVPLAKYKGSHVYFPTTNHYVDASDLDAYPDLPAWGWAVHGIGLPSLDARSIMENELDGGEFYEDAIEHFDIAGLQVVLDRWVKKHRKGWNCYAADESIAVIVRAA